ncbi:hypothetical protein ACU6VG_17130 [Sphaerotilus sulfidivorans]|uniref:hypothetical protein n=1 Tax=Sphaerotilus sp. FB-3 TaxID=2913396 RepID=UPI00203ED04D|nr:hypothetical protein [Sphaerotilus sp. FB-3]GKQ56450.1 hypothetical protein QMTAC487_03080 [Sphaerotilus sp. FB-3]
MYALSVEYLLAYQSLLIGFSDQSAVLVSASQPLMDLAATVIAVRNGSRRTEAKAQASRENGRKGGRPRKAEAA